MYPHICHHVKLEHLYQKVQLIGTKRKINKQSLKEKKLCFSIYWYQEKKLNNSCCVFQLDQLFPQIKQKPLAKKSCRVEKDDNDQMICKDFKRKTKRSKNKINNPPFPQYQRELCCSNSSKCRQVHVPYLEKQYSLCSNLYGIFRILRFKQSPLLPLFFLYIF